MKSIKIAFAAAVVMCAVGSAAVAQTAPAPTAPAPTAPVAAPKAVPTAPATTTNTTAPADKTAKDAKARTPESIACSAEADAKNIHGKERDKFRKKCMQDAKKAKAAKKS